MKLDLKNISIRRLLYTRRYMAIAVSAGLLSVCIALLGIFPQIQGLITTTTIVKKENQTLLNLRKKLNGLTQVEYLQEYANKSKVENILPSEKPLIQLLASTSQVAELTSLHLTEIQTNPGALATRSGQLAAQQNPNAPRIDHVAPLTILVKAEGPLSEINAFMDQIEQAAPVTNVTQIKLSKIDFPAQVQSKQESSEAIFAAELELTTYYFTQVVQIAVDEPLPQTGAPEQQFLAKVEKYFFPDVKKFQAIQGGGTQDLFQAFEEDKQE